MVFFFFALSKGLSFRSNWCWNVAIVLFVWASVITSVFFDFGWFWIPCCHKFVVNYLNVLVTFILLIWAAVAIFILYGLILFSVFPPKIQLLQHFDNLGFWISKISELVCTKCILDYSVFCVPYLGLMWSCIWVLRLYEFNYDHETFAKVCMVN